MSARDTEILTALLVLLSSIDRRLFEVIVDPLTDDSIRDACFRHMTPDGRTIALYGMSRMECFSPKRAPLPPIKIVPNAPQWHFRPTEFGLS